ncbi:YHYH domain-containing protein [Alteromonas stellipolaris]|uniref:YHYH domain-containing protein n=1 Tax=Alteromonas stellipolaris TaxID=233316 RepID=UPI0026E461E2|nr:YHYH domain-containing protein [Alteromonas stellipolaris]MDO6536257.1 YHYH domain-containing protein [Alteromonas stellipolaris]MDO6627792.1 YHYH domain-containing protein [Alteromonas stellipolaris]
MKRGLVTWLKTVNTDIETISYIPNFYSYPAKFKRILLSKMCKTIFKFLVILIFLTPSAVQSHGGGTNANGCHNDHQNGGYHCHEERDDGAYSRQMDGYREHNLNKLFRFLVISIPIFLIAGSIWYFIYSTVKKEEDKTKKLVENYKPNFKSAVTLIREPIPVKNDQNIGNIGFSNGADLSCYACGADHNLRSYSNCNVCKQPKCRDCNSCSEVCRKKQIQEKNRREHLRRIKHQEDREAREWRSYLDDNPTQCICGGTKKLFNVRVNKHIVCSYCKA